MRLQSMRVCTARTSDDKVEYAYDDYYIDYSRISKTELYGLGGERVPHRSS